LDRTCVQASKVGTAIIYKTKTMYKEKKGPDGNPFTRSKKANKSVRTHVTKEHNNEDTTNNTLIK
jgi:hypothetical protein